MLDKFTQDINNYLENKESYTVDNTIPIGNLFGDSLIKESLSNLSNLDDRNLYEILKSKYSSIIENVVENEDVFYLDLFTDSRFLTIFTQAINSVVLTRNDIIYCNKISYDYLTNCNDVSDEYLKSLFYNMSKVVNKNILPGLLGLNLNEDYCSYLALCRFSSTKESVNVRRVNHLLISSDSNIIDEQMIIYIYEKLFDSMTTLLKHTMFDPYTSEELKCIGPGAGEIYSNISLAIIDILNMMPSNDIYHVLLSYAKDYNVSGETNVRFSIRSLAICDYSRILNVVDNIEYNELIIVP